MVLLFEIVALIFGILFGAFCFIFTNTIFDYAKKFATGAVYPYHYFIFKFGGLFAVLVASLQLYRVIRVLLR